MDQVLHKGPKKSPRILHKMNSEQDLAEQSALQGVPMRAKTLPPPPDWAISQALGLDSVHVSWLAGDGSDRCYYRLHDKNSDKTFVLMQLSGDDAAQLAKDGYEWIKISSLLNSHAVSAPQTIAALPEFAALIIEDYGDVMMESFALSSLEKSKRTEVLTLYEQAFTILNKFLGITEPGSSHWQERSFDKVRFDWELHFFREQFLEGVLGWKLSSSESAAFSRDAAELAEFLATRPQFFVHRDFHSRNIMVKNKQLAVIDFQDARLGPATYDLVSLCFDSYIPLEFDERKKLLHRGLTVISSTKQSRNLDQLSAESGPMLLQRQLKAIGSFGYLTTKKNRGNYLRNVAPALATLGSALTHDNRWPFLSKTLIEEVNGRWQEKNLK